MGRSTVTLHDQNQAVLGALTTIGSKVPGTLRADNGLLVEFGKNVIGYGTIETPNDASRPLTNNGYVGGVSAFDVITLAGYVDGVGSLDNVRITGTLSPGFSPASVQLGSVAYDGLLTMEIGGSSVGEFDQLHHMMGDGVASLGGTLEVQLIGGFVPSAGDTFELITAIGRSVGRVRKRTLAGAR